MKGQAPSPLACLQAPSTQAKYSSAKYIDNLRKYVIFFEFKIRFLKVRILSCRGIKLSC